MSKKIKSKNSKPVGYRPRLSKREQEVINNLRNDTSSRVLVIGDVHAPFERKDYLQFCKDTYKKYNCNTVVFIGDIIDSHYSSYHETDADGMGGSSRVRSSYQKY